MPQKTISSLDVAVFLVGRGFIPASLSGVAIRNHMMNMNGVGAFGLLVPELATGGKGCFCHKDRRRFVGVLWFKHVSRTTDGIWKIDNYGSTNLEKNRGLSSELGARFKVRVSVNLERYNVESERFDSDFPKLVMAKGPPPPEEEWTEAQAEDILRRKHGFV